MGHHILVFILLAAVHFATLLGLRRSRAASILNPSSYWPLNFAVSAIIYGAIWAVVLAVI